VDSFMLFAVTDRIPHVMRHWELQPEIVAVMIALLSGDEDQSIDLISRSNAYTIDTGNPALSIQIGQQASEL
jgi:hypothetical protein